MVLIASVLLSLFLARTIVHPLRKLARAAVRVRLGRAREVVVPRLPSRRDEIGTLARALSDMTQALRERIDAGEHFAADVTHELKNPIASVRSAIEGLGRVTSDEQRAQLLAIADEDVRRLDRLVTDISDASRIDAQLSRTLFEPIDIGLMIESMLAARAARVSGDTPQPRIAFARPRKGTATVMGDGHRIERAIDNVIDNALSFSPPDALVCIAATRLGDEVHIRVDDDGPGIPPAQREAIFRRFHSERPDGEAFGRHSGLGLAIARTIVEGHGGTIAAGDREDGKRGASLLITLPAAENADAA
jgi:two-component system sensor histidine kinase ChvG